MTGGTALSIVVVVLLLALGALVALTLREVYLSRRRGLQIERCIRRDCIGCTFVPVHLRNSGRPAVGAPTFPHEDFSDDPEST